MPPIQPPERPPEAEVAAESTEGRDVVCQAVSLAHSGHDEAIEAIQLALCALEMSRSEQGSEQGDFVLVPSPSDESNRGDISCSAIICSGGGGGGGGSVRPPPAWLDYIRALGECGLVSPKLTWELPPAYPLPPLDTSDDPSHDFPREVVPSKSLNSRPNGSDWRNDFDRICTPCDWQDLGRHWHWGDPVNDVRTDVINFPSRVALPYAVDAQHKSLVLVQHAPGFKPTGAPFLFVGQRLQVAKVVSCGSMPWHWRSNSPRPRTSDPSSLCK